MRYRVKNWSNFQHYKKRTPPWIKLHRGLLDDKNWWRLPLASRALAPCIWLLASENDGEIVADAEEIAWRLRTSVEDVQNGLKSLISQGWLVPCEQHASGVLATCEQHAPEETEAEAEREEKNKARKIAPDTDFWRHAKAALGEVGIAESTAGSIVGKLSQALGINTKTASPDKLTELLQLIETGCAKTNPRQWLMACATKPPQEWAQVQTWIADGCQGDVPGDDTTRAVLADHLPELQAYPADLARARFCDYYRGTRA